MFVVEFFFHRRQAPIPKNEILLRLFHREPVHSRQCVNLALAFVIAARGAIAFNPNNRH
jgi:hypothetical protein